MVERLEIERRRPVLSIETIAPPAWAAAEIAEMSCISNVFEPGDSVCTSFVFGFISLAMSPPMAGS